MLNIEGVTRAFLQDRLGVPCYVSVPANPPARFAVVDRGAGSWESPIHGTVTVVVDYWGDGRSDSEHLADAGDKLMHFDFEHEPGIAHVEPNNISVHYPDVASSRERYESTYIITTYEY